MTIFVNYVEYNVVCGETVAERIKRENYLLLDEAVKNNRKRERKLREKF